MKSTVERLLIRLEPRTMAERRFRLAAAILIVIACLGHATVLMFDDHAARVMFSALGLRCYLAVMYAEYGIGFFILYLLFIHFVRPQNPWS